MLPYQRDVSFRTQSWDQPPKRGGSVRDQSCISDLRGGLQDISKRQITLSNQLAPTDLIFGVVESGGGAEKGLLFGVSWLHHHGFSHRRDQTSWALTSTASGLWNGTVLPQWLGLLKVTERAEIKLK
jgi:hypothetical protein